jgi:hypothetical protein
LSSVDSLSPIPLRAAAYAGCRWGVCSAHLLATQAIVCPRRYPVTFRCHFAQVLNDEGRALSQLIARRGSIERVGQRETAAIGRRLDRLVEKLNAEKEKLARETSAGQKKRLPLQRSVYKTFRHKVCSSVYSFHRPWQSIIACVGAKNGLGTAGSAGGAEGRCFGWLRCLRHEVREHGWVPDAEGRPY